MSEFELGQIVVASAEIRAKWRFKTDREDDWRCAFWPFGYMQKKDNYCRCLERRVFAEPIRAMVIGKTWRDVGLGNESWIERTYDGYIEHGPSLSISKRFVVWEVAETLRSGSRHLVLPFDLKHL